MSTHRARLNAMRAAALTALRPPSREPLSDWLESNFRLPSGLAAVPGPIRLWTFQRALADAMTDPEIERVTVLKGARLGYSTLLLGVVAHYALRDPSALLAVLPTEDDARNFMVGQLEPAMGASPALRGVLSMDRTAEGRDTLLYRRFPGGSLRVVAARAPRNLRAHTARVLILDEADAMEVTSEGSPILLAEKRTLSFSDRKIITGSTPTNTSTSHVAAAYDQSDKRVFEVPCPSCRDRHEILWRDIRWPEDRPQDAAWCCPSCGVLHGEEHKARMVAAGRWRATAPHVKGHAGFRLSCLIAPHGPAAWPRLAAEFLIAKRHPDTLRTFVNTILAEPWRDDDTEGAIDPSGLAALAAPIGLDRIPASVLFLASGVDVQGDRIELSTLGFTAEDDWLVLAHTILAGDPLRDGVWHDLADILRETYTREDGARIARSMSAIDAGDGGMQDRVVAFARSVPSAVPIKGVAGARPLVTRSDSKRARLWLVGVDAAKQRLHDRLTRRSGFAFADTLPDEWRLQLTAERRAIRYQYGRPVVRWETVPGRRAEALDCAVYALAARAMVGTAPSRRADELTGHAPLPARPIVVRSRWLER